MYIALRHNKVVHYSQNAYDRVGSTLVCEAEGISIDSATMAQVDAVPTDIDEYDYYYIEGNFIKEDFKVAKLKQEIIDQESTTQEILTNTDIIKTDTNTIKSNVADIKSDTDLIGSTTDTGGSTTAGTVMGKLNKLISESATPVPVIKSVQRGNITKAATTLAQSVDPNKCIVLLDSEYSGLYAYRNSSDSGYKTYQNSATMFVSLTATTLTVELGYYYVPNITSSSSWESKVNPTTYQIIEFY